MPRTTGNNGAAKRMAASRARAKERVEAVLTDMPGGELTAALRDSLELLAAAGLPAPTTEDLQAAELPDRVLGISRLLSAAAKAVDLARARGELVRATVHRQRLAEFAGMLKRCIGQMPAHLPADLTPENRAICTLAMARACEVALAGLERKG